MSLYDEMKYKLRPVRHTRGWKYHQKHESTLHRDSRIEAAKLKKVKKLDAFFK